MSLIIEVASLGEHTIQAQFKAETEISETLASKWEF